jgi:hypothetical protein
MGIGSTKHYTGDFVYLRVSDHVHMSQTLVAVVNGSGTRSTKRKMKVEEEELIVLQGYSSWFR